jgi:S-adenosylmethionine-diacylglycerol 3-amino-3-carboxypropyl transferase
MRAAAPGKVELHDLIFTQNWEDPALDRAAFELRPGGRVATVCSGACNTFAFLLDDPSYVLSFDYNPTQVWVLELKGACFKRLEHDGMLELLGVRASARRARLLEAVLPALSPRAREYWMRQPWLIRDGLLNAGRYERFVGLFGRLLRAIQGRRRVDGLFRERDRDARERFYEVTWDNWRWRLLFRLFFNKAVMSRRGLSADYFRFDDGTSSFAESFARRTRQVIVELPVHTNYFLAQYVHGRYLGDDRLPEYLRPEHFETIRRRVERVEMRVADVRDAFDDVARASFDGICLTNVFELMSEAEMAAVLPKIASALRPGGRMTLRNLMIPRSVPRELSHLLVLDAERSRALHRADRSFVYRSFQVYQRAP